MSGPPAAGGGVGAGRQLPPLFGEEQDLDGVDAGDGPCVDVAVATVLTNQVGGSPQVTDRMAGNAERATTRTTRKV
jgi:hypothetical protein